jgi:PEP-CTERM motif
VKSQFTQAIRPATLAAAALALVVLAMAVSNRDREEDFAAPDRTRGANALELDFQFIAVPEPGALVTLIGGGALLIGIQRFRRRT